MNVESCGLECFVYDDSVCHVTGFVNASSEAGKWDTEHHHVVATRIMNVYATSANILVARLKGFFIRAGV